MSDQPGVLPGLPGDGGEFRFLPPSRPHCPHSQEFAAWTEGVCESAISEASPTAINQAKVFLLNRYFQWRAQAPKSHRGISGAGQGHICIYEVFETAYLKLHAAELNLVPPPIEKIVAPPPQASRPGPLAGLVIGMVDPDPEFGDLPE